VHQNQILYDSSGRRRRIVNIAGAVAIGAFSVSIAILVVGFLIPPKLVALGNRNVEVPVYSRGTVAPSHSSSQPPFSLLSSRKFNASAVKAKRFAILEMDDIGQFSLKENVGSIDGLLPDFLVLRGGELGQRSPHLEQHLRRWLSQNSAAFQVYPILSNGVRNSDLASYLSSESQFKRIISDILSYLEMNGDAGITLNFEEMLPATQPTLFRFLQDLRGALRASNKGVILILPDTTERSWMQNFAQVSDFILVNLHKTGGSRPEPLASQGWFESRIAILASTIDPSKLIIGIGAFGYDFGRPAALSKISIPAAWSLLRNSDAKLSLDERSLNPWFRYTDAAGVVHDVWLLDGVTFFNQARAALTYRPAGLALSAVGFEDPSVWAVFGKGKSPNRDALSQLESPPATFYADPAVSRPETLIASNSAVTTVRNLSYNKYLGLIVKESLERVSPGKKLIASPYVSEHLLAITFDDGPDSKITNKILDILRTKSVKATFFVVGKNALQNKEILQRAYDDGHDIGNHTYGHPRVSELSTSDLELELTSTQRVLEATLGIHTKLFRPTFGGSPEDPENLGVIEKASRLNYLTVLAGLDSFDWVRPPPPPEKIVDAVLKQVAGGKGQILLFHDWGKKQATLQALPLVIDALRARGFQFVTVHELLGKTRHDVMPTVSFTNSVDKAIASIRQSSLLAVSSFPELLLRLGLFLGGISVIRCAFVIFAARGEMRREREREQSSYWPSVAVIVPAYNEEKVICKTIKSVLASSRKDFEVIVVDDGSKDATAELARQTFADDPRVKVFVKSNGGKATAANFGLRQTDAEVVVCIDADTVLSNDAIPQLVRHFAHARVGAVAGTAVVGNNINLLTQFQALEYTIGQYLDRRAFAFFNAIGVVPGAIGAWRRQALLAVGGYSSDTLAEDADATFAIVNAGWRVINETGAEARTEAPEKVTAFLKQRYRWMFGTLQVVVKHTREAIKKKNGLCFLTIPAALLSLLGFALFVPVLDTVSIFYLGVSLKNYFTASEPSVVAAHLETLVWWIAFQVLYLLAVAGALAAVRIRCGSSLVLMLVLQRFLYAPLLYWVASATTLRALKGEALGWGKLARTGSVSLPERPKEMPAG
jgi:cellulose synthase/poly-beta-1,6-N-acetylglucosamine synthase-like glycosyltransferase/peptidoglycan/xylan/chitin deacetylase (PgdA/CDA1 family)